MKKILIFLLLIFSTSNLYADVVYTSNLRANEPAFEIAFTGNTLPATMYGTLAVDWTGNTQIAGSYVPRVITFYLKNEWFDPSYSQNLDIRWFRGSNNVNQDNVVQNMDAGTSWTEPLPNDGNSVTYYFNTTCAAKVKIAGRVYIGKKW
jgi:hypothetical protein